VTLKDPPQNLTVQQAFIRALLACSGRLLISLNELIQIWVLLRRFTVMQLASGWPYTTCCELPWKKAGKDLMV